MIRLEPLQKEDFSKIVQWNKDKSPDFLLQWAGPLYEYPLTEEQIEKYYHEANANKGRELTIFKIVMEETDVMVGTVEIREYEKENNTGRVGRFLVGEESTRGKGVGGEALTKLVRIGFEEMNYDKISLGVFDFNQSAIACYQGVGFEKERLIENAKEASTGYWNLYEMSITRENWEQKKKSS